MIQITPTIAIDENEIKEEFIHAAGPGGQNVNKVATAVQLRFNVFTSPSITNEIRHRLVKLAGHRLTSDGILVIKANRFRTQRQNRKDAQDRLVELLQAAAEIPKHRYKTSPTLASKKNRLESKRRRSQIKKLRGSVQSFTD